MRATTSLFVGENGMHVEELAPLCLQHLDISPVSQVIRRGARLPAILGCRGSSLDTLLTLPIQSVLTGPAGHVLPLSKSGRETQYRRNGHRSFTPAAECTPEPPSKRGRPQCENNSHREPEAQFSAAALLVTPVRMDESPCQVLDQTRLRK